MDFSKPFSSGLIHHVRHAQQDSTCHTLEEIMEITQECGHLVRAVGPLVRLMQKALHEGLPVCVDGLRHVQEVVLLRIHEGVQSVV